MARRIECDICKGLTSASDGPPENHTTKRRCYGRYRVKISQTFWDGLPFGYRYKTLDVCAGCMDRICREVVE